MAAPKELSVASVTSHLEKCVFVKRRAKALTKYLLWSNLTDCSSNNLHVFLFFMYIGREGETNANNSRFDRNMCVKCMQVPMDFLLHQGPCYINFDRFPLDQTKAEEEFSGWDRDF